MYLLSPEGKTHFPANTPAAQWVKASMALLEVAVPVCLEKSCTSLSLPVPEGKSRIPGTSISRSILFCQGTFFQSLPRCLSICMLPEAIRGSWLEPVSAENHLFEPLHPSACLGTLVTFWGCELGLAVQSSLRASQGKQSIVTQ